MAVVDGTANRHTELGTAAEGSQVTRQMRYARSVSTSSSAVTWAEFAAAAPDLADFGARRLADAPAYLGTVKKSGAPRVHPVTPIITHQGLFIFMEPTSPKRYDLTERDRFALHNGVPDNAGSGGEFFVTGCGALVEDLGMWRAVASAAAYEPAPRYILFELKVDEARCIGYGDIRLPETRMWTIGSQK